MIDYFKHHRKIYACATFGFLFIIGFLPFFNKVSVYNLIPFVTNIFYSFHAYGMLGVGAFAIVIILIVLFVLALCGKKITHLLLLPLPFMIWINYIIQTTWLNVGGQSQIIGGINMYLYPIAILAVYILSLFVNKTGKSRIEILQEKVAELEQIVEKLK